MRKLRVGITYWLAALLIVFVTGCGQEVVKVPFVVSTIAANGATNVVINTPISATFSIAMSPASITGSTFTLTEPGGTAVSGAVTYSGLTATFTPAAALAYGTTYTGTITTGATDWVAPPCLPTMYGPLRPLRPPCGDGNGPRERRHKCARQSGAQRDLQRGDEPCNNQCCDVYSHRAGWSRGNWSRHLFRLGGDLYTRCKPC